MNDNKTMLLVPSNEIQHIELGQLKPHPRNEEVYGSRENITDLVESIKLKSYVQPLIVTVDGTIISGHRRWRALTALGWKEAPVVVCNFETEEDELFVLIAENRHRQQTPVQRIREGMTVEPIARKLRNSHAAQKVRCTKEEEAESQLSDNEERSMENFPLEPLNLGLTEKEMELTENIVAAIVGLGCGRNYRKGRTAVKAADNLKKDCPDLALLWLHIINDHSIDAGYQIAKMPDNKRSATLEAIASGAAKTLKQAKALSKDNSQLSSSAEGINDKNSSPEVSDSSSSKPIPSPTEPLGDRNLEYKIDTEEEAATDVSIDALNNEKYFSQESVGSWVIVKIPFIPKEKTPERKWNRFWGRITEVGATLKVDMGPEVLSLLQSDVELIENPPPSFCKVAERILRLQSFDTVHDFGKIILSRMQQTLSWDSAALLYLKAVEDIEAARRAIEQAL